MSVDPILDGTEYDLTEYVYEVVNFTAYLYIRDAVFWVCGFVSTVYGIVKILLRSETTDNMGIFIEMCNNMYEYCFWLNVDIGNGFNEFGVTQRSKEYLQKI